MGGDRARKADNAFVFSLGCEVCTAERKLPCLMKLKRYGCPSPWELLYIHKGREGLLEK